MNLIQYCYKHYVVIIYAILLKNLYFFSYILISNSLLIILIKVSSTLWSHRAFGWSLDLGPVNRRPLLLKETVKELLEALKVLPGDLQEAQISILHIKFSLFPSIFTFSSTVYPEVHYNVYYYFRADSEEESFYFKSTNQNESHMKGQHLWRFWEACN